MWFVRMVAQARGGAGIFPRSAAGGIVSKIFAEEVPPGDDAFKMPVRGDDGAAGHAMLQQESCGGFHGRVGGDRDECPAHDLMGAFVERRPVAIGFGQLPDVRAHSLQQVAI